MFLSACVGADMVHIENLSILSCMIFVCFWADPGGTAIPGLPVGEVGQARLTLPCSKNQFNILRSSMRAVSDIKLIRTDTFFIKAPIPTGGLALCLYYSFGLQHSWFREFMYFY